MLLLNVNPPPTSDKVTNNCVPELSNKAIEVDSIGTPLLSRTLPFIVETCAETFITNKRRMKRVNADIRK